MVVYIQREVAEMMIILFRLKSFQRFNAIYQVALKHINLMKIIMTTIKENLQINF